jgi:Dyp-type peroxidase family
MTDLRLDLADIQGNILRGYRSPVARYVFLRFGDATKGRSLIEAITHEITTSVEWDGGMPPSTVNVAFTWRGLEALDLPPEALAAFPLDFRQGLLERARMLGEVGPSDPDHWEPLWREEQVHCFVMIGAKDPTALATRVAWLEELCRSTGGATLVGSQDAGALIVDGKPSNKEHFGYSDGFGNPDIAATGLPPQPGGGKPTDQGWAPVAAGEFLLGHLNEVGEIAHAPPPINLFRNGTFVAYRKLHQNVGSFRRYLAEEGARVPGGPERLAAKMVGRWRDGTPLALSPDRPDPSIVADDDRVINFRYADDPDGLRCPLGSHIRRANPRDALGFGTSLTQGRRIIRRGLPYGSWTPADQPGDDTAEHGVIFIALCASLQEQFEFVLQQWINYGNDFNQGNDPDPLVGNRAASDKMVIPGDASRPGGHRPHLCFGLPQFVETRGGAYFFMPSVTALRWIVQSQDALEARLVGFDRTGDGDDTVPMPSPGDVPVHESLIARLEAIGARIGHEVAALPHELAQLVDKELGAIGGELHHIEDGLKAWAVAHPERIFAVLRRLKPILTIKDLTLVTRFEDVQEVLSRDTVFQVPYADNFAELTGGRNFFLGMSNTPEYQRDVSNMRIVVRRDDIPTRIAPFVGKTADAIVAAAPGRLDVVQDLALRVATDFVADYFGTPSPTPDAFATQAGLISGYLFLSAANLRAGAQQAAGQMLAALRASIAARKAARGMRDDVLERCLRLQDAGVPGMDDDTLAVNLFGLVVGAIPTTAAMAARALDELLRRPNELAMAHAAAARGDSDTVTKYVSEAMRFNPLGPGVPRIVMEDYTIARGTHRATTLKAGSKVLAVLQSATFDGDKITSPGEFRTDRPPYEYMHFGYGLHTCFGQYINMVQIPRIAQAVLSRPNLRRAAGLDGTLQMDGPFPAHLVVEFDPTPGR